MHQEECWLKGIAWARMICIQSDWDPGNWVYFEIHSHVDGARTTGSAGAIRGRERGTIRRFPFDT